MESHSVTCHPTEVRIPPLPPAEAGTRFSDPGGMQDWVDLCYMKADRPGLNPPSVNRKSKQRPTAKPPRNTSNSSSSSSSSSSLIVQYNTFVATMTWLTWVYASATMTMTKSSRKRAGSPRVVAYIFSPATSVFRKSWQQPLETNPIHLICSVQ